MEQQKLESAQSNAELQSTELISRKSAKEQGLKRYFTGKPCKHGHVSERHAAGGTCYQCSKIKSSKRRKENIDSYRKADRECYARKMKGVALKKKPKGYWLNKDTLKAESLKYKTKSEMKASNQPAYLAMSKLKISGELFPEGKKSNGYWTIENCIAAVKEYSSISELSSSKDAKAYQILSGLGLIRQHTKHMNHCKLEAGYWTMERCRDEALKFETRNEFRIKSASAYTICHRVGLLDEVCDHMVSGFKVSDSVYIWKAKGIFLSGVQVYKIGISKNGLVSRRASIVSSAHNIEIESLIESVVSDPHKTERKLLKLGIKPKMNKADGYTEFRSLTSSQYSEALSIIKESI